MLQRQMLQQQPTLRDEGAGVLAQRSLSLSEKSSPELQLLLSCTKLNRSAAELVEIKQLVSASIQWDSFADFATYHGVAALVFRTLGEEVAVPYAVRSRLRELAKQTALRNLKLIHELLSLHELCRLHQLAFMPYKGPALSAIIYGDSGVRDTTDLDFLIRPSDLSRLNKLLVARGYVPEQGIPSDPDSCYLSAASECGFVHPDTGIRIDAHWNIAPRHLGIRIVSDWFWDGASQVELNGVSMPAMRSEKLLLALCTHGTKHAWERLKWVCDLGNLLRANPELDWSEISQAAVQSGAERALSLGLWMAHRFMAAPVPAEFVSDSSTEPLADLCLAGLRDIAHHSTASRNRWLLLWKLQPGWINKVRAVRSLFAEPEIGPDKPPLSSVFSRASLRRVLRSANVMVRN